MQAQHTAAAKAALKAAMAMAEEAQTAAKEAESVASAKQYNAAHLSSKNITGARLGCVSNQYRQLSIVDFDWGWFVRSKVSNKSIDFV